MCKYENKQNCQLPFHLPSLFFVIPCVPAFLLQIMTHPQAPPPPLCRASAAASTGSGTPLCTFPSAGLGCGAQRLLEAGEVRLCQAARVEKCSKSTGVTPRLHLMNFWRTMVYIRKNMTFNNALTFADICNTFARCRACHWVLSTELCLQLHGQQLAWGSPLQGLQSASANAPSKMPSYSYCHAI